MKNEDLLVSNFKKFVKSKNLEKRMSEILASDKYYSWGKLYSADCFDIFSWSKTEEGHIYWSSLQAEFDKIKYINRRWCSKAY